MRTVTDDERRARLGVRHALAQPVPDVDIATRAVTCLHATEPASVYLSAFARCGAARDETADALYERRSVVRQLAMRRTVFAFPRDLLPAVRGSAAARVAVQQRTRLAVEVEAAGIADDGPAWVADVCARTLAVVRDEPASTTQLRGRLPDLQLRLPAAGRAGGADSPIASRVLTVLAADGCVVRGDNDGGWKTARPRWTAIEQWLDTDVDVLDEAAGYAELTRRWLWSFGPGTEADLTWWLGATKTATRRALADVGAVEVRLDDGTAAFLHPDDTDEVAAPEPWAALLPTLDPTTMGWQGRRFYLGEHAERIFDRNGNGGPTAWWNGRIVGGWRQDDDGAVVFVPFDRLPRAATRALVECTRKLTTWFGGDVVRSTMPLPVLRER